MNAFELGLQRLAVRVVVAVLAVLAVVTTGQGQTFFSAPVNVSRASGGGPQVVVDQNGHVYVLWLQTASGAPAPDLYISRSVDGGASFSAGIDLSATIPALLREWPAVSVDANGNIDVIWLNETQPQAGPLVADFYFTRSTDGGASFSAPLNISTTGKAAPAAPAAFALGPDGNINIAWMDGSQISFSRSVDGRTFSAPQNISNSPVGANGSGGADLPFIAVDSSGNINLIWTGYPVTPPYGGYPDIFFSRSTDGGTTFSIPQDVTNAAALGQAAAPAYSSQVSTDAAGNIDVFWTNGGNAAFVSQSNNGGSSFSGPRSVPFPFGQITVDGAGNIDVFSVSSSISSGNPTNGTAVYQDTGAFSRSADGGMTFSSPQQIATGYHTSSSQAAMQAKMVIDALGNIDIAVAIGGQGPNYAGDLYVLRSSDGGTTFTSTDVSGDGGYMTYYAYGPTLATDTSGHISVAWEDSTTGNDILFSRASSLSLSSVAIANATITGGNASSGTIILSAPAPAGGVSASLSTNNPAASVPATVMIPAGSTSEMFNIETTAVSTSAVVTISASVNGATQSTALTILPAGASASPTNPSFTVMANPSALTILGSGQSASTTLTFISKDGLAGAGSLSSSTCGVAAAEGITCSLSSFSLASNGAATATLTFKTTASSSAAATARNLLLEFLLAVIAAPLMFQSKRRQLSYGMTVLAVSLAVGCGGCTGMAGRSGATNQNTSSTSGAMSSSTGTGTPTGTVAGINASITINGVTQTVPGLSLTVQ